MMIVRSLLIWVLWFVLFGVALVVAVRADELDYGAALVAEGGTMMDFTGPAYISEYGDSCAIAYTTDKSSLGLHWWIDMSKVIKTCGIFICVDQSVPRADLVKRADDQWVAEVSCGPADVPVNNGRTPGCADNAMPVLDVHRFREGWQARTYCPPAPCGKDEKCEPVS